MIHRSFFSTPAELEQRATDSNSPRPFEESPANFSGMTREKVDAAISGALRPLCFALLCFALRHAHETHLLRLRKWLMRQMLEDPAKKDRGTKVTKGSRVDGSMIRRKGLWILGFSCPVASCPVVSCPVVHPTRESGNHSRIWKSGPAGYEGHHSHPGSREPFCDFHVFQFA